MDIQNFSEAKPTFCSNYDAYGMIKNDDEWLRNQLRWHPMAPKQTMDAPIILADAQKYYE